MKRDKPWSFERRMFPRVKENIFVFCRRMSCASNVFKVISQNISAGGLCFGAEKKIFPGNEVELEIYQPIDILKEMIFSMPIVAKVIWVKKISKDKLERNCNRYKIGVKFSRINGMDRQRIATYVQECTSGK